MAAGGPLAVCVRVCVPTWPASGGEVVVAVTPGRCRFRDVTEHMVLVTDGPGPINCV